MEKNCSTCKISTYACVDAKKGRLECQLCKSYDGWMPFMFDIPTPAPPSADLREAVENALVTLKIIKIPWGSGVASTSDLLQIMEDSFIAALKDTP